MATRFHFGHQPQRVLAVDLADLGGGVALLQQRAGQVGPLVDAVQAFRRAADAVEIAAQAHGIDARDLDHVVDMLHDVGQRARARPPRARFRMAFDPSGSLAYFCELVAQAQLSQSPRWPWHFGIEEVAGEVDLHHAAFLGQRLRSSRRSCCAARGEMARQEECEAKIGALLVSSASQKVLSATCEISTIMPRRFISATTSLPNGDEAVVGLVGVARRIRPVVAVGVGEGHVADAQRRSNRAAGAGCPRWRGRPRCPSARRSCAARWARRISAAVVAKTKSLG